MSYLNLRFAIDSILSFSLVPPGQIGRPIRIQIVLHQADFLCLWPMLYQSLVKAGVFLHRASRIDSSIEKSSPWRSHKLQVVMNRWPTRNLVMYRLPHEKKNYGFTPNLDFNPLPTKFNFTEFPPPSRVCSISGGKRTSKHGISMVIKLVSIEYQKRDAFLAAM